MASSIDIKLEESFGLEVYCACGEKLNVTAADELYGNLIIEVDRCSLCAELNYSEGYDEGAIQEGE